MQAEGDAGGQVDGGQVVADEGGAAGDVPVGRAEAKADIQDRADAVRRAIAAGLA